MKTNVLVKGWVLWLFVFSSQFLYPPLLKLPMIRKHNEIAFASPLSRKHSPSPPTGFFFNPLPLKCPWQYDQLLYHQLWINIVKSLRPMSKDKKR